MMVAIVITFATAATVKAQTGYCPSNYQTYVQQQVLQGGNRVCVYVPTQHTNQNGFGVTVGGNYGNQAGWSGSADGNYNYQNQQSYAVTQPQCGRNYMPQQGQQFYIQNQGYNGYRTPVMVWDSRLNRYVQH